MNNVGADAHCTANVQMTRGERRKSKRRAAGLQLSILLSVLSIESSNRQLPPTRLIGRVAAPMPKLQRPTIPISLFVFAPLICDQSCN